MDNYFNRIIDIVAIKESNYLLYTAIIMILAALIYTIILINGKSKKISRLKSKIKVLDSVLKVFDISKTLEKNLYELLSVMSKIIEASAYGIYFYDKNNKCYVLKTIRHRVNDFSQINPSYSGLLPYKKEEYFMPPTLQEKVVGEKVEVRNTGEVPLLFIPLKPCNAAIVIGPVKSIKKGNLKFLEELSEKVSPLINGMLEIDQLRKEVKVVVTSDQAVKNISNLFTDFQGMLQIMMKISVTAISAKGGMFITTQNGNVELSVIIGLDEKISELVKEDKTTLRLFNELINGDNFKSIIKGEKEFFRIPPYFISDGAEGFILLNSAINTGNALAVFWYDDNPNIKEYQVTALQIMVKRMVDIINNHVRFKELSTSYVDILKSLARLVDNLKPSTSGYSELMYRYAVIISKEMNLSKKEIKEIGIAAYLSNIGIIGISDNILFKNGKYTDIEYETMKLHSEIGASIIEATIGDYKIASYIRYHHERIDGYGYPSGIIGEDIPLGARIIAVVQTFLAKIIAREYRSALTFENAIEQIRKCKETQLDSEVVEALIRWFNKKQQENMKSQHSLGPCWEMRCAPENICINCDAYKNLEVNCWEVKENNCSNHGNNCNTCFVRTEFLNRMGKNNIENP